MRRATQDDLAEIVDTLASAFMEDPIWGPPFVPAHRAAGQAIMWEALVGSALDHDWVLVSDEVEAASVWIPPGVEELPAEDEQRMHRLLVEHTGARTADLVAHILETLDAAKPKEPCYFLSLLGTHARHRGLGIGMDLLRHGLDLVDQAGASAYLESSNPANDRRYLRFGFEVRNVLELPTGPVTTMWRGPR